MGLGEDAIVGLPNEERELSGSLVMGDGGGMLEDSLCEVKRIPLEFRDEC